ncbi:MAG: glycosyltransferase family 4 protein [Ardenticatenia bacterium]|nr:glycosyltransferase family 4 protein [Ardenticatenia bacterium]
MNVALVTPGFSAHERDWCIPALLELARALAATCEVTVIALRYPPRRGAYAVGTIPVHALGGGTVGGLGRLPLFARALWALKATPADIYHAYWGDEPGALSTLAGRLSSRPALVSLFGGELVAMPNIGYGGQLSRWNRLLVRITLCCANMIAVGSRPVAHLVKARGRTKNVVACTLGVNARRFTPAGERVALQGRPVLLHVASLVPVKDQATLLGALAALRARYPRAHLHIVGDGPLRAALVRLAFRLGVRDHVTFHGPVAHDRLPPFYRAADVLVSSSRFENQSLVILEAAACGTPTAGTAVGLVPELHELGVAQSAPPGDPRALADATARLLEADAVALARRSREVIEARFSLERTVETLTALYARATRRN